MAEKSRKRSLVIWSSVLALLLGIVIAINAVALSWDSLLEGFMGTVGGGRNSSSSLFTSAYASDEELKDAQKAFNLQVAQEAAVLLKNDNSALPLDSGSRISLFSRNVVDWVSGGKGSGAVSADSVLSLKTVMEDAGFVVNPTLWNFYLGRSEKRGSGSTTGGGNVEGDWKIGETPLSAYTSDVKNSYANDYNDAAIIVISRISGEGSDLPTNMDKYGGSASEHYLELNTDEKDLIKEVAGAGFKKVILLLNCANTLELGFVNDPENKIDAVLWLMGTGNNGINALSGLFNGTVNPSGRLVDTYVYDNFSAPAMQNLGDFRYINDSLKDRNGNPSHSYMNYGETMYMGYRYYETRYEDFVLGRENVGEYDYANTVVYPFGYGLSYTKFEWSDFKVTYDSAKDEFTASIKVKNVGSKPGKDVVEIYAQSPYTQYDIDNKVEKPSVSLIAYVKTNLISAGGEEEVSVSFDRSLLASYDYMNAKTYVLEASEDYYFTAATDAHAAVNNILAAKEANAEKMVGEGDASLTQKYAVSALVKYDEAVTGNKIENHFDDSRAQDAVYLSRNNWKAMDNNGLRYATGQLTGVSNANVSGSERLVYTREASNELATLLTTNSWEASGNPKQRSEYSAVTVDGGGNMQLAELIGADYDDQRWEKLLDQLKASEMHTLYNQSGYCTKAIESIGKPNTYDYDGPSGIANFLNKFSPFGYCSEVTLASTWNKDLALKYGEFVGEDGLKTNTTGWYAPAMNLHRTPFSGRNFEYYSEDPILSGMMAAQTTIGVQSKGMYTYMKHFAVNDQETNRSDIGSVAIWLTEQSLRELYLRPFQLAVEKGGSKAVMTSMVRIGTRSCFGNYPLLTQVLRGEWGFVGMVITDYCAGIGSGFSDQILAAGGDMILSTAGERLTSVKGDNRTLTELRRATKNILFTVANSAGMSVVTGFPIYKIILITVDVLAGAGILVCAGLFIVKPLVKRKKEKSAE